MDRRDRVLQAVEQRVDRAVPDPVQAFVRWLRSDDFLTTSASLAFYAMVSLAPMALVALWVAGAVVPDSSLQRLGSDVEQTSPDSLPVADLLRRLIDVATGLGFASVLGALWPATAYGAALARAFGRVTPDRERRMRGWKGRAMALVIVALMPLVVFGALAVSFVGPRLLPDAGPWLAVLLAFGGYLALLALTGLVFTLFRLLSTEASDIAWGALVASTLISLVSGAYLLYLRLFAGFEQRYGASWLATAVLLGLWLLLVNAMLIIGYRLMVRRAQRRHPRATSDGEVRLP